MRKHEMDDKKDRKLEVAAFLRSHEAGNRERLMHIGHILNGTSEEIVPQPALLVQQTPVTSQAEREEKEFWRSFRRRCIIALILTIFVCVGKMSDNEKLTESVNVIQQSVLQDEAENLFDFIQQITYTWEYEKINVEG